ncbi:ribonuclease H-like domain-containing protein [Tanacetum coccineum]|uniref:Ribonuclease H-like domain-containing protein n=1 Tax=Tanacetum coccineum TaxID=301880 RepID=A0ABQ5FUL8_9ASTR
MFKGNGTGERKLQWNNVQRVNKQNQFVPLAVQTRTGNNPVNTAKASSTNNFSTARQKVNRQTVLTSTALKVNTVKPNVNDVRPANVFHKTHSPSSRPFKRTTVLRTNFSNQKVYTAKVKEVSTVGGKWDTADNPHRTLKNKGIIDSGCSRHMTGNKAYLADFQDFNGGPVAFGGSKGYITGKGKIKTEFKNKEVIEFCGLKGIKREYSNARTPQQNGVAERKNRTLIEAARTMLADSFLPNTFWAEAVSTACYVLNRVLVTKPHNKTPYELLTGKTPIISYIRPFGCHVTILNTIDHLGKFVGKSDEGFLVGYSLQSKAFRVYNLVTKRVEENLHIKFLENKPNVAGKGPNWLFDLDYLTDSMNYHYVSSENQANLHAGQQDSNQSSGTKDKVNEEWEEQVFLDDLARLQRQEKEANEKAEALRKNLEQETENLVTQAKAAKSSSTNIFSTVSTTAKASVMFKSKGEPIVRTFIIVYLLVFYLNMNPRRFQKLLKMFLYGKIDEEVYVSQPPGFQDPKYPEKVYKVVKALYGLHPSTPRWVMGPTLSTFLYSDYAGANLDRKSTTGGCQFLGRRLITWQCKKQTIVATSTTEAEYVAAASCCGQVLWIQNQMLDYGFNFMNTKIYIDNESTICIVKNPVYHSKTKHIAIRHHFIRDAYEKKLIQVLKIHTNDNVADLLTKAFDVSRFQFLVVSIGMINP